LLRPFAETPLVQKHIADCVVCGSNSQLYRLRQFSERLKRAP
jgi:hypothetical protein